MFFTRTKRRGHGPPLLITQYNSSSSSVNISEVLIPMLVSMCVIIPILPTELLLLIPNDIASISSYVILSTIVFIQFFNVLITQTPFKSLLSVHKGTCFIRDILNIKRGRAAVGSFALISHLLFLIRCFIMSTINTMHTITSPNITITPAPTVPTASTMIPINASTVTIKMLNNTIILYLPFCVS